MGIVNCSYEFFGSISDTDIQKHYDISNTNSIPYLMNLILNESKNKNLPPLNITNEIAYEKMEKFNPIFNDSSFEKADSFLKSQINSPFNKCSLTGHTIQQYFDVDCN